MKKIMVAVLISTCIISMSLISPTRSGGTAAMLGQGNTGAPCDTGNVCGSCHLGGLYGPTTETITLRDTLTSAIVASYLPGKTYDVEVRVIKGRQSAFPQGYGFQATALGPDTTQAGTWLDPSNVVQFIEIKDACGRLRTYAEHSGISFSSTFRMRWQAPWSISDSVTFYYVGNAVNRNGSTSADNGGQGARTTYPPAGVDHLILDVASVMTGEYFALDSISLSTSMEDGAEAIFTTQSAVRLLPNTEIPADATLEINMKQ